MNIRKLDKEYMIVIKVLETITSKEQYVIVSRVVNGDTLQAVGDRMGVTPQMVRIFEQSGLRKIKEAIVLTDRRLRKKYATDTREISKS